MKLSRRSAAISIFAVIGATSLLLSGCASTSASSPGTAVVASPGKTMSPDIKNFCPSSPEKVAYAYAGTNSFIQVAVALIKKEAAKCSTITDVITTDAGGDQQKSISDLNSLVAQGVKAIVITPGFGAAQLPSITAANKAGVGTVPVFGNPGGQLGVNYPALVDNDNDHVGSVQADWLNTTVKSGNVIFLGGPAGTVSSQAFFDGFSKAIAKYPNLKLLEPSYVSTDWTAGGVKQTMSGLLAKYGQIDAVVTDFGSIDTGVIDAFSDAGLALPALATQSPSNANGCQWQQKNFPFFAVGGAETFAPVALRKALAANLGVVDDEPSIIPLPAVINSTDNLPPTCDPSLPADADLWGGLTPDELKAVLG